MKQPAATLYYFHDPMCSWCWGFRPVWQQVQSALAGKINIKYILGGLAPDTDEAMPESLQATIQSTWRTIQQEIPGTEFNFDFWNNCKPRRSTYVSCRAVIACRMQQPPLEKEMILAIQRAYYLNALNPSDSAVLVKLAGQLGLDAQKFVDDLQSEDCQNILEKEIMLCRDLYIHSFPSLLLKQGKSYSLINIDYNNCDAILDQIA